MNMALLKTLPVATLNNHIWQVNSEPHRMSYDHYSDNDGNVDIHDDGDDKDDIEVGCLATTATDSNVCPLGGS